MFWLTWVLCTQMQLTHGLFRNNLTHLENFPWKFKPPSSSIFYLLPKNIFFSCSGEHIVGVETVFYFYEPIFKSKSLRGPPSPSRKNGRRGNNNILFQPPTHVNSNSTSERLRLLQCCFLIVFIFWKKNWVRSLILPSFHVFHVRRMCTDLKLYPFLQMLLWKKT